MKSYSKLVIIITAMLMAMCLSSCSESSAQDSFGDSYVPSGAETALNQNYQVCGFIVDTTRYSHLPEFNESGSILNNICKKRGRVIIATTGGDPYIAYDDNLPEATNGLSETTADNDAKAYASELAQFAKSLEPTAPENDILKCISLTLRKMAVYSGKQVLVIESPGIFTTGAVDMSLVMSLDADSVINKLSEINSIPSIEGDVTVVWIGLGEPSGDQPRPSDNDYHKLEAFYQAYFAAAGVENAVFIPRGTHTDTENISLPDVSIYEFPNISVLSEDSVEFEFDSATFKEPDKADAAISSIARNYNVGEKILVVGFASSEGEYNHNLSLSENRAKKVAVLLTEKGLNPSYIGLGYDLDYCINDTVNGIIDEEKASKNRKIMVIKYDSSEAQALIRKSK